MRNERIRHSTIRHMPAKGARRTGVRSRLPRGSTYGRPALRAAYSYTPFVPGYAADADARDRAVRRATSRSRRHAADARAEGSDSDSQYVTAQRFVRDFRTAHAPPPQPAHGRIAGRLRVWIVVRHVGPLPLRPVLAAYKSCT